MSRRTQSLPPLTGFRHIWREIRYHEASRQISSVVLIIVSTVFGEPLEPLYWIGAVFVVFGLGMRLWASGHILKNRDLATSGPYALVRHPLYTGNIALLLGFAAASGLWWVAVAAVAIIWTFFPPTVAYEDAKMREKFPEKWAAWAPNVPAVVPDLRLAAARASAGFEGWSFKVSLRRNGEPFAAMLMIALLVTLGTRLG